MSRFSHFLSLYSSSKRDRIIEKTPTFQGRQKMIKCLLSSLKDLARRDRMKERGQRLFSSRFVLFRSPESWDFRGVREIAGKKKNIIIIRKRSDLFFFFFFSLTAFLNVLTQFFSLSITNIRTKQDPLGFFKDLAAGGVSGSIAKTATAPIERVKLLIQTQDANPRIISGKSRGTRVSWNCFTSLAEQGVEVVLEREHGQYCPLFPDASV